MIKVSVCIITYNHEKFVAKTLDSLLDQKTTFDYEIIVGDDCSKDRTRDILKEYQSRYPDKIKLLLHPKNLGLNGRFNALATFRMAKGEYIAQFDGDDFTISNLKLQKQVDMLDQNPQYIACFHNALVQYDDINADSYLFCDLDVDKVTLDDLIGEDERCFIATSSLMFKRLDLLHNPDPSWTERSTSGDIPRNILFASRGPIGYIPETMVVYRKNLGGASFVDDYQNSEFIKNRIELYSNIDKHFNYKYHRLLKRNIARYYRMLLDARQYQKSYFRRAGLAIKYIAWGKPGFETAKDIIRDYVLPKWMMKFYSFVALLPHRLKAAK
jgi:glycosyltransferase involved in cell wall biosynthesis